MQSSRASEGGDRREEQQPSVGEAGVARSAEASSEQASRGRADGAAAATGASEGERQLRAELERMEDRYKRALADLENYRKRSARETERRVAEAQEDMLRDWLEALDSVERALRMTPEDEGLRAVLTQMEAILQRQGVTRLGAAGEPFNPEHHDAIATRSANGVPDRTIVEVARSGFALGDRVLRPAQVVVSRRQEADG